MKLDESWFCCKGYKEAFLDAIALRVYELWVYPANGVGITS